MDQLDRFVARGRAAQAAVDALTEIIVSFELSPAEIQQLRDANWRNGRADLQAQTIVRDYLLRQRLKAERKQREKKTTGRA
jgi:hypothetical protein